MLSNTRQPAQATFARAAHQFCECCNFHSNSFQIVVAAIAAVVTHALARASALFFFSVVVFSQLQNWYFLYEEINIQTYVSKYAIVGVFSLFVCAYRTGKQEKSIVDQ